MTPDAEPPFRRIGIAGLGLIGASIALATRATWPSVELSAFERADAIDAGARAIVDRVSSDIRDLATADLVVLALPVGAIVEHFDLLRDLGTQTVVTDVGSTKRDIMAAAARVGVRNFVGGHPMSGSERGGRGEARVDLFRGRPWLLVQGSAETDANHRVESFTRALGGEPIWLDAETHDRVIAYISHLPQVLAVALMNSAAEELGDEGLGASGRAFAEMTRLASSPADLWQDILATNADFVGDALDQLVARLPTASDLSGRTWTREVFARAAAARQSQIDRNGR